MMKIEDNQIVDRKRILALMKEVCTLHDNITSILTFFFAVNAFTFFTAHFFVQFQKL